jgi:hypothetical protein
MIDFCSDLTVRNEQGRCVLKFHLNFIKIVDDTSSKHAFADDDLV